MTMRGETVLSGAPHPGTDLEVLESGAGFYLGYRDTDGTPYSRETLYMTKDMADKLILLLRTGS